MILLLFTSAENFAQSLEIKDPVDEIVDSSLSLSSPPHGNPSHFTTDIHTASSEVEVQVLQTGTSGITGNPPTMPPSRRGRGKSRKHSKTSEKQQRESLYVEQKVVSDGEFEVPLPDQEVTEVVLSTSLEPSVGSSVETHTHIEVSEAAKNLALLATHVTSIAPSEPLVEGSAQSSRGGQHSEMLKERHGSGLTDVPPGSSPSVIRTSPEAVSSEIVAVAEVMSSGHGTGVSTSGSVDREGSAVEGHATDDRGVGRRATGKTRHGRDVSQEGREREVEGEREELQRLSEVTETDSGSVRRSRRKVARVRRLVSDDAKSPPPQQRSSESPRKTPAGKKSPRTVGSKRKEVAVVEERCSPPPAKRTRRSRTGQKSPSEKAGGEEEEVWGRGKHPSQWGVEEVVGFVRAIPQCACCTEVFKEHVSPTFQHWFCVDLLNAVSSLLLPPFPPTYTSLPPSLPSSL